MKIYGEEKELIAEALGKGEVRVAVYGLGKMGLPLAAVFAEKGALVTGVDVKSEVVRRINQGINPVKGEPGLDELVERNAAGGRLSATTDLAAASRASDVMVILVPTLLDRENKPDLSIVESVCRDIAKGLEKGDFVVLESTVPIGTTDTVVKPLLEESGLKAGVDFGLAFCPERTSSGRAIKDILGAYPKIVGGIDPRSTATAEGIYMLINEKGVIPVSSARAAEAVKLAEGLYRDVNIALANELAITLGKNGVDIWEVIEAANTQPFCHLHKPGAGVGGHCIPVYPWFVINGDTKLIRTAREVNDRMPAYVVQKVVSALRRQGRGVKDSRILVVGLVYRPGVGETYHSPAKEVIRSLKSLGARVYGYDPVLSAEEAKALLDVGPPNGGEIDCAVFMHDCDYEDALEVKAKSKVTLDNLFR